LLHGKTLLVTTPHDLENITLELLAQSITIDLLGDPFVKKGTQLLVVIDLKLLLAPGGRVGNVELHGGDAARARGRRGARALGAAAAARGRLGFWARELVERRVELI